VVVFKFIKEFLKFVCFACLLCDLLYYAWVGKFSSLVLSVYNSSMLKLPQMPPRRAPNNNDNDENNNNNNNNNNAVIQ
jgi:hypothetical protein